MAVDQTQLLETLKNLHQELSSAEQVDPSTLELLEKVTEDLAGLLERSGDSPAHEAAPITNGLQELLCQFEGKHPRLTTILQQVIDSLGNLGI